jgi:hypothetical protein
MKRYALVAIEKIAARFGLFVIFAESAEDRKYILESAAFRTNDIY